MKKLIILILIFSAHITANATSSATFEKVMNTVISQKCFLCHNNPDKKPFDLATYEQVMSVVVPGSLDNSKLYQALINEEMPPPKILDINPDLAITAEDLALIEQWILDGAKK